MTDFCLAFRTLLSKPSSIEISLDDFEQLTQMKGESILVTINIDERDSPQQVFEKLQASLLQEGTPLNIVGGMAIYFDCPNQSVSIKRLIDLVTPINQAIDKTLLLWGEQVNRPENKNN